MTQQVSTQPNTSDVYTKGVNNIAFALEGVYERNLYKQTSLTLFIAPSIAPSIALVNKLLQ